MASDTPPRSHRARTCADFATRLARIFSNRLACRMAFCTSVSCSRCRLIFASSRSWSAAGRAVSDCVAPACKRERAALRSRLAPCVCSAPPGLAHACATSDRLRRGPAGPPALASRAAPPEGAPCPSETPGGWAMPSAARARRVA
eukprot:scaffold831_cov336-Prasinococcus_capsulatus_cf.AAC.9